MRSNERASRPRRERRTQLVCVRLHIIDVTCQYSMSTHFKEIEYCPRRLQGARASVPSIIQDTGLRSKDLNRWGDGLRRSQTGAADILVIVLGVSEVHSRPSIRGLWVCKTLFFRIACISVLPVRLFTKAINAGQSSETWVKHSS